MNIHNLAMRWRGLPAMLLLGGVSMPVSAGPHFSEWDVPTQVPNQVPGDGCPIESRDGNSLYTASRRDGGDLDIFTYERNGRAGLFSGPKIVEAPVSEPGSNELCPTPLAGGWFMFVSNRDGGCGGNDLYSARYNPDTGWSEPSNLGCDTDGGPNTTGDEWSPSLVTTSEGTYLYYSNDSAGTQDIYKSHMDLDGSFGPGIAVSELNTGADDRQPNVRRDGLEIVFASNRAGAGQDVWTASRDSVQEPWSGLRNLSVELGFPSGNGSETRPSLSWDRKRLYYGSAGIIYMSERTPGNGGD